jgi:hypothetical protein
MLARLLKADDVLTPTSSGSETWCPEFAARVAFENVDSGCKGELNKPTTGSCLG